MFPPCLALHSGHMATATYSSSSSSLFCRFHDTGGKWHPPPVSKRRNIDASISRRSQKGPRHLITIGTSDRRWHGQWTCNYVVSLRDLRLSDLVEDEQKDAKVLINLSIEKHAGFGLSIDGRITTSFTRKCSNCSSPYCREMNTSFNVWILTSHRVGHATELPEIGGDDPSVIYVKPGYEAHLDQLIRDTLRLTTSVKDTCSESCEKSEPTLQYIGGPKAASVEKRWCRLLELKNTNR
ncbi:large ribosomal RNA subunit accumulation protein YCED homolog 2, chloroplastic isoform X2 [Rhodamnia argentea]|uniref:Large ribosomal RNA subunit accumulation protein YCED homolog 2, chloroplastic isoform X2 n=1 Tax=Rhodamnia argentea TaxID=178133 RepID=A0A8B8NYG8_9MYRT|nr:large ribosomal RNA subunit accumulation protein YCED homolog 2, chloroplastic isoform X2 [Rhodamnia argentea]